MRAGGTVLIAALAMLAIAAVSPAPAADFSGLVFHPHPGRQLPLAQRLTDEHDRAVKLHKYFAGEPVILVLEYLHCKTYCGVALGALATALDQVPLNAGRDFQVVAVSIDPRDKPADAMAAKAKYLAIYRHPDGAAGWHFLTGPQSAVRPIAAAVGFPYRYDAALDQYMHPVGFVVAAPNGIISRYLLEIDPTPAALQEALAGGAQGQAQGPLTRLLLWCHGEDPILGRYTIPIEAAFAVLNLSVMVVGTVVFASIWRRRHR
jgi:protein SCO1